MNSMSRVDDGGKEEKGEEGMRKREEKGRMRMREKKREGGVREK